MRLCWGVIYCVYTLGRYWIAFKWQGDKFLVWGFGGLRVTWYLTCECACEESLTRKSSILKRWLAGVVTWFCAVHMNAINRSRISTAFTAWPEMSGVPLHWRKRKKLKWRWRDGAWQAACFTIQTGLRAAQPAEFMYIKICYVSEKNLISDVIWIPPPPSVQCENASGNCEKVVNELYLPSWTDFSEDDMLINSGMVLWIVFARL